VVATDNVVINAKAKAGWIFHAALTLHNVDAGRGNSSVPFEAVINPDTLIRIVQIFNECGLLPETRLKYLNTYDKVSH
jgi:hypothetical protein